MLPKNLCAYLKFEKGTIVSDGDPLVMNNLIRKPIKGDTYKYLGTDDNISYHGPINKEFLRNILLEQRKYGLLTLAHTTR